MPSGKGLRGFVAIGAPNKADLDKEGTDRRRTRPIRVTHVAESSQADRGDSALRATLFEHVRVVHGRADIAVAQQFLDRPDVIARFEQVRREWRKERHVAGRGMSAALSASSPRAARLIRAGDASGAPLRGAIETSRGKDPVARQNLIGNPPVDSQIDWTAG